MPLWRDVLRLCQQQQRQLREALAPTRGVAEFVARQTEGLAAAVWGMTREQYRTLSPEDRALLFGSPEPPTPPAPEPASVLPRPVVRPRATDPEPEPNAPVTDHDTWMLRQFARRHPNLPAELEGHQELKTQWLTTLTERACARRPGSDAKVHRNRLRPKLQALIDSQRSH
jgi:hypothetical protein